MAECVNASKRPEGFPQENPQTYGRQNDRPLSFRAKARNPGLYARECRSRFLLPLVVGMTDWKEILRQIS